MSYFSRCWEKSESNTEELWDEVLAGKWADHMEYIEGLFDPEPFESANQPQ